MSPASRVAGQRLSPIRRMAVGAPPGTVSLGLGEPGWPAPQPVREALARLAGTGGPLPYGPNTGLPALVAAIAARHDRPRRESRPDRRAATSGRADGVTGHADATSGRAEGAPGQAEVSPEQVMVTSGSQAALFALFQAHVEPGSAVLVPDPGFVSYPALARLCGAEPVGYPLSPSGDLDPEALVQTLAAAPHTSLVVVNHPANPTGGTASPAALALVADACARTGALLVSDEVYRELWVQHRPASLHDVVGVDGGVVLGSLSKAFAAPGLRVGWAVGAPDVLAPARIVHNAMTTAPAQPSQAAAVALLEAADQILADSRRHVAHRWRTARRVAGTLLDRALVPDGRGRAEPSRPPGADPGMPGEVGFYLWVPVPDGVRPERTEEFALRVRDESLVTTVPGTAFGPRGAGFLRVGLGGPLDEVEEGLRRLAPWWEA